MIAERSLRCYCLVTRRYTFSATIKGVSLIKLGGRRAMHCLFITRHQRVFRLPRTLTYPVMPSNNRGCCRCTIGRYFVKHLMFTRAPTCCATPNRFETTMSDEIFPILERFHCFPSQNR